MSRNTNSPAASFELTTTSADKSQAGGTLLTHGTPMRTATQPSACPIIEITLDEKWPEGYKNIDQVVAEAETDPAYKAALEKARAWAADTLYPNEISLRTLRLKRGLSQARLAELLQTTQS